MSTFSISPIAVILPNDDNVSFGNISLLAISFNASIVSLCLSVVIKL
ncbi:hypothetical protein OQL46_001136 [Clostridium perfringens]